MWNGLGLSIPAVSMRGTGASGGSGPVTSVTVVGALADVATATLAPAVTNGQAIPLDTAGWVLLIQCSGAQTIADATKLTVNITRPGNTSGLGDAATTRADTALGVKALRRAYPNQLSGLPAAANAFYITIDNLIHASDTLTITLAAGFFTDQASSIPIGAGLITNSSGLTYAKPIVRPATLPLRRFTTTATVEFAVISEWAAFGSQVARVEARGKIGASYGPWAASGTMTRSASTPSSGRFPSTIPVPVYSVTVDLSSLANSASRTDSMVVYRAYGWYGDVLFDSETDGQAFNASGLPSGDAAPVGLPIIKDAVGNHTPIYAWVNRDGTAGASAAIQTGTTDPGSAASYASEVSAFTAARTYNLSGARTNTHNDTSGLVILYRDVASGALGNSTGAYWQRASWASYSDGLLPPVMCSASYLASGTTTLDCRARGVQDDGVTAATSKRRDGVFEYRGITFDGIGLTGTLHQVSDGQASGAATTAVAAVTGCILIDCDIRENSAAGSTAPIFYRPGWRWDVRVDQGGLSAGEGPVGVQSLAAASSTFSSLQLSIGSLYSRGATSTSPSIYLPYTALLGVWARNISVATPPSGIKGVPEFAMLYHVRIDQAGPASVAGVDMNHKIGQGIGMCGVFVRRTGTISSAAFRISGDATRRDVNNFVVQHIGADSGANDDQDRTNFLYQEQGFIFLTQRGSAKYCAFGSYNIKDDIFPAPELGSASVYSEGAWAGSTQVYRGVIYHDGNVTAANRVFYQAIADFVTGAVQATDLADTARWLNLGLQNSLAFGAQPLRTGNWRAPHGVRQFGNCATKTANGDTVASPGSWYGEAWGRGGSINTTWANYYKTRTGGALSSFTTWGDYRPQSIAAGDANDSPLLARVPTNAAVSPFDLSGVTRLTNGTGAAGPYERSA